MAEVKANGTMEAKAMEAMKAAAAEQTAAEAPVQEAKKPIFLTRSPFKTRDGRKMWSYYVAGQKYGREIKAEFTARDAGGFGFLDMLFAVAKEVQLVIRDEVMEGDNGRKTYYKSYEAQGIDPEGEIVSIKIRPKNDSDKAYLALIIGQGGESAA